MRYESLSYLITVSLAEKRGIGYHEKMHGGHRYGSNGKRGKKPAKVSRDTIRRMQVAA